MPRFDRPGDVIPLPTWLLNEDELETLRRRLLECVEELRGEGRPDSRDEPALAAIEAELERRGIPVTLIENLGDQSN